MKKLFLLSAILFATTAMKAQGSDVVNVNITINQLMALEVFNDQVNISITTPDEFANGKTQTMTSHLRITANVPYEIQANANGHFIGATENIGIENLKASLTPLTGNSTFTPAVAIPMATTPIVLGESNAGDIQRYFDVTYQLLGGPALLVTDGVYTSQITYTVMPL